MNGEAELKTNFCVNCNKKMTMNPIFVVFVQKNYVYL